LLGTQTRCAGLSASAKLLVIFGPFGLKLPINALFGSFWGIGRGSLWNWASAPGVKKLE